ncbi:hypothetical protein CLU79DRAFT_734276 [Phycomyces nitens]|nr:hypothetical protein CLU79DRAFT_734276 [Phycomyces nitens]
MAKSPTKPVVAPAKKTPWRGISIKRPTGRPESIASVQSQDSQKSTDSEKLDSSNQVKPDPALISVEEEMEQKKSGEVSQTSVSPIQPKGTTLEGMTNETQGEESGDIATPRASRSRASSFYGLDSASEVFEDAYDDNDESFEDDDDSPIESMAAKVYPSDLQSREAKEKFIAKEQLPDFVTEIQGLTIESINASVRPRVEVEGLVDNGTKEDLHTPTETTSLKEGIVLKDTLFFAEDEIKSQQVEEKPKVMDSSISQPITEVSSVQKNQSKDDAKVNIALLDLGIVENDTLKDAKFGSTTTKTAHDLVTISPSHEKSDIPQSTAVTAALASVLAAAGVIHLPLQDLDQSPKQTKSDTLLTLADGNFGEGVSHGQDSGIAVSQTASDEESDHEKKATSERTSSESDDDRDCLGSILPAISDSLREYNNKEAKNSKESTEESLAKDIDSKKEREMEFPIEPPVDLDVFKDNTLAIQAIDIKSIPINDFTPRQQEVADEPVLEGINLLFDNQFMRAKAIFQTKANIDPVYALGLGAMAFIKAMMTFDEKDISLAMNALATAYTIGKTQVDNSLYKKPLKDTVFHYFATFGSGSTGLPPSPIPIIPLKDTSNEPPTFIPNGVLRAHVAKAECCLLMGILQMSQESVIGYLKCGLNLRRAYNSYSVVWQEYRRMGQEYNSHIDHNTVSGIQFGIGAVHLLMSSMPSKILKIFSTFGWKGDKQLGFALLKLCLEGRGLRSPLASLALLTYYSVLTSFAPQLYAKELMSPAIECLLDAQKNHPNSCFFLFFAAHTSRVARNVPLSTQSFDFAAESSKGEWAEHAMKQMADYEIGINLALQLDWESAAECFENLTQEKYWSPAFSKYVVGACRDMLGERTDGILAFAEVPQLAKEYPSKKTYMDAYVHKKVEFFQRSGYQDMDFSLPGLELLLVMNAFEHMDKDCLEMSLKRVHETLELIYEREKMEYTIRLRELVPTTTPPNYYDQRAVLLLIKSSILNTLGRYSECISHLNWIIDHKESIKHETWVAPFAYWESGITSWGLGNPQKSRQLWQLALACTKYDFEYRMSVRLTLALNRCDEFGIEVADTKAKKGPTTNGRKRMPIVPT